MSGRKCPRPSAAGVDRAPSGSGDREPARVVAPAIDSPPSVLSRVPRRGTVVGRTVYRRGSPGGGPGGHGRSGEGRVGGEGRVRGSAGHLKKKKESAVSYKK